MFHIFAYFYSGCYYSVLKKANRPFELYDFKLQNSATEATLNIANAFGLESSSERILRYWFEKFSYGDSKLEVKTVPKLKTAER